MGSYLGFHPLHGFPMGNIDTFETICNHFTLHIFFTILSLDLIFMWNVIFSILFLKCFQTILWLLSVVMTSECAPGILWFSSSYTSNTRLNWSFWQIRVRRDSWRKKTDYVWLSNKAPPPPPSSFHLFLKSELHFQSIVCKNNALIIVPPSKCTLNIHRIFRLGIATW